VDFGIPATLARSGVSLRRMQRPRQSPFERIAKKGARDIPREAQRLSVFDDHMAGGLIIGVNLRARQTRHREGEQGKRQIAARFMRKSLFVSSVGLSIAARSELDTSSGERYRA